MYAVRSNENVKCNEKCTWNNSYKYSELIIIYII